MKSLPRLVIVLALCFTTIALLPTPAQAAVCRFPEILLSVDRGVPGDPVTVRGKDFDPDAYVDIYYYVDSDSRIALKDSIIPDFSRSFSVEVTIPESATGDHRVRAIGRVDGQIVERDAVFRVKPGVMVSPAEGPVGIAVTAKGRGFAEYETAIEVRYYFNGSYERVAENIEADARGSWEATIEIPTSTRGEYRITARGAKTAFVAAVRPATFQVKPVISMVEPSGSVGQSIPVSGSGFAPNESGIRILLAGEAVATGIRADDSGYWEANFTVPAKPAGQYSLTAEGGITSRADVGNIDFELKPGLTLSPAEGHVGMNLTAVGLGFPAGKAVVILYDDEQVATATADDEGGFHAVFLVPPSRYGKRQVAAAIDEGTNSIANFKIAATAYFIMDSDPPPTPEPISPNDGRRVGFVGKVRPTFEWSEVEDDSGVYYNLQVATSADFTAPSVVVSVTGLTGTSYTLENEALSFGTYYWAVQAVDSAENESGWSQGDFFRAGRLPLWAFIVIMVFVGILLLARLRALLIRRLFYS